MSRKSVELRNINVFNLLLLVVFAELYLQLTSWLFSQKHDLAVVLQLYAALVGQDRYRLL
jgi:hypothetical protein